MLRVLVALLLVFPAVRPARAQGPRSAPRGLNDRGSFEIYAAGKNIGTETFEIRARADQIEAQGDVHLQVEQNGKNMDIRTASRLLLDGHFEPLSYTWNQRGAKASQLSMDFHSQPVQARYKTVNGRDDQRGFMLAKDVLVLDDNALDHYQLAIARYDAVKGGTQTFRAFIPQEAMPGMITLNSEGPEDVAIGGEKRTLHRFHLTTELAQINLWVDDEDHLQMVSAPDAQFQAVRKK